MSVIHELPLVSTIAIGLSMAFVCGFIATKLRLSPLIGYVLAGVIVGPHSPGLIVDISIAEQLSEIGIVLLMFGVGLHFSIQDFMEVKKVATIGALSRIGIVTLAGWALSSMLWGWSLATGLVFGLSLSVSSTVVLLRVLEDHHLMQTIKGKISIGWLVVEDIATVLAMVLIPALAVSTIAKDGSASSLPLQVAVAFGKVGLFAAIMFIGGRRVLPWLLSAVSRTGSRELFTLAAISMAMGIAFSAAMLFGVSLALGAFFAGMMIRESDLNHEVADRVLPLQDAFAVLFFVSVGMLFDPAILYERPLDVLEVVFLIIAVKAALTFVILMGFRYPLKTSLIISAGLAQIGEFSFILIALGASLGMMPEDGRDLVLAGALISIALNPFIINAVLKWCDKRGELPAAEQDVLAHLESREKVALKNLVILIGFGRVGALTANMMDLNAYDLVIVDSNREKIERLRELGFHAIAGDATEADTLIEAGIEKANTIMLTVPDHFDARRIVEQVRSIKPEIRLFVRSHNSEEEAFFNSLNVDMTISPTEEIARRMITGLRTT